jgi:hypothetical protein
MRFRVNWLNVPFAVRSARPRTRSRGAIASVFRIVQVEPPFRHRTPCGACQRRESMPAVPHEARSAARSPAKFTRCASTRPRCGIDALHRRDQADSRRPIQRIADDLPAVAQFIYHHQRSSTFLHQCHCERSDAAISSQNDLMGIASSLRLAAAKP